MSLSHFVIILVFLISVVTTTSLAPNWYTYTTELPSNCKYKEAHGFVLIFCRTSSGLFEIIFPFSDNYYTYQDGGFLGWEFNGDLCENDPLFYQVCPGTFENDVPESPTQFLCGDDAYVCFTADTDTLYPGFIAERHMKCDHVMQCRNMDADETDCRVRDGEIECKYSSGSYSADKKCDDNCDDESECNGYRYGMFCTQYVSTEPHTRFIKPGRLCDGTEGCLNGEDETFCGTKKRNNTLQNVFTDR